MTARRPRTGEARRTNQPLTIDKLPLPVHDAIQYLRVQLGKGWDYIERLSAMPYSAKWSSNIGKHGFVDWEQLPTATLELFPDMKLPHSTLHRWWDLRIVQVKKDVLARSAAAREIAEAFVKAGVAGDVDAVMNASRDVIFSLLEQQDAKGRLQAGKALLALAEIMQEKRANDVKERAVAVSEREIAKKEQEWNLKLRKMQNDVDKLTKGAAREGGLTLSDINKLRENTFGLPPVAAKAAA